MKLHEEARAHTQTHPHQLLHVRSFQITHQFEWVPRFWCDDFFDINFVVIHGVASFNSNGRWCWQPQTREICLKFVMLLGSKFIAYGSGERLKSVFAERMRGNMWR